MTPWHFTREKQDKAGPSARLLGEQEAGELGAAQPPTFPDAGSCPARGSWSPTAQPPAPQQRGRCRDPGTAATGDSGSQPQETRGPSLALPPSPAKCSWRSPLRPPPPGHAVDRRHTQRGPCPNPSVSLGPHASQQVWEPGLGHPGPRSPAPRLTTSFRPATQSSCFQTQEAGEPQPRAAGRGTSRLPAGFPVTLEEQRGHLTAPPAGSGCPGCWRLWPGGAGERAVAPHTNIINRPRGVVGGDPAGGRSPRLLRLSEGPAGASARLPRPLGSATCCPGSVAAAGDATGVGEG